MAGAAVSAAFALLSCGQSDEHPPVICSGYCAGGTRGAIPWVGVAGGSLGGAGGTGGTGSLDAGSGGSEDPGDPGGSGGQPDAGGDPLQGCVDYCEVAAVCGDPSSTACFQHCDQLPMEWDATCLPLKVAEFACIAELDCAGIDLYDQEGRANEACGPTYLEFAEACLLDGGVPPEQCAQYCETGTACSPDFLPVTSCADACAEDLTRTDRGRGTACMLAKRDVYGCIGQQSCEEVQAFVATGVFPQACLPFVDTFIAACP